jgi:anaerobic selenocysteine-containing dehydrogenase
MPRDHIEYSQPVGDHFAYTTCYMCACRCGIKVHLRDGALRYIEGNRHHPVNRGVLCAKGSAGIMNVLSPARLRAPLKRMGPRGSGEFAEISWDEALTIATDRLRRIRETDPNQLAFFTGRDQSQSLTGFFAQMFGTINYAAHGGFCTVNMAAAGLYSVGGAFWEFGEPDWELTKLFLLIGVAEDHDSNPIKLGLGRLKERGAKIISINPVRTGYSAIADEFVGITPGTDGLLVLALIHCLLEAGQIDLDLLVRYTNAHYLAIDAPGDPDHGLFARDKQDKPFAYDRRSNDFVDAEAVGTDGALLGTFRLPDGRSAQPAFAHAAERYLAPEFAPEAVAARCGVPATTIKRIAAEIAEVAFNQPVVLDQSWTDTAGRQHQTMVGRPIAATGLAAFNTVRPLDGPHFTENYVLREMGYQIAPKHAVKLRRIAATLAFLLPGLLTLLAASGIASAVAATAAALSALIGMFVERWLFFAEATHVSTIYYGR